MFIWVFSRGSLCLTEPVTFTDSRCVSTCHRLKQFLKNKMMGFRDHSAMRECVPGWPLETVALTFPVSSPCLHCPDLSHFQRASEKAGAMSQIHLFFFFKSKTWPSSLLLLIIGLSQDTSVLGGTMDEAFVLRKLLALVIVVNAHHHC